MSIYERNLEALSKKQNFLKEKIENHEYGTPSKSVFIEEEIAKDGTPILVIEKDDKKYNMNSKYKPKDEAKRFASQFQQIKDYAVELVFGFGNGYFPREIIKMGTSLVRYAFFEPCMESFLYVIKHYDISDILGSEKVVVFIDGINELEVGAYLPEMVEWVNLPLMDIAALPRYKDMYLDLYERYLGNAREVSARVQMGMNTWITYAHIRLGNEVQHLHYVLHSNSIDDFKGAFPKKLAAILVSAGPSLVNNIQVLKKCKGKFFILCVDTAVKKLLDNGIIPDAIIGVDSCKCKAYVEEHKEKYRDILYIQKIDAQNAMIRSCNCDRIAFIQGDKDYIYNIYKENQHPLSDLATGGSVANTAFSLLEFWGFQTIILVGQDLALTGGKRYVEDSNDAVVDAIEKGWQIYEVEGYHGETVKTRDDYFSYLGWFEGAAAISPAKVINATEGGARIHGVEQKTLEEVYVTYGVEVDVKELIQLVPEAFDSKQQKKIQEEIEQYLPRIEALQSKFIEGKNLAQKGKTLMETPGYSKGELAAIDKKLERLDVECKKWKELDMVAARACKVERQIARDRVVDLEGKFSDTSAVLDSIYKIYEAYIEAADDIKVQLQVLMKGIEEKGGR